MLLWPSDLTITQSTTIRVNLHFAIHFASSGVVTRRKKFHTSNTSKDSLILPHYWTRLSSPIHLYKRKLLYRCISEDSRKMMFQ